MSELKYIGKNRIIPGVPPRDLTKEEAEKYKEFGLVESGLYTHPPRPAKKTDEVKDGR